MQNQWIIKYAIRKFNYESYYFQKMILKSSDFSISLKSIEKSLKPSKLNLRVLYT